MKKTTLALLCVLLSAGTVMAQKKFTFGPKIGVDFTHFWGKNTEHFKGALNYQAGVFFEYRFTDKFSIAPEVVFAAQGAKEDLYTLFIENVGTEDNIALVANLEKDGYATYNTNYVNVPVMFKYYVIPSLSIDLGPQLGVNVYSKKTYKDCDNLAGTEDLKDYTKIVDVGVALGLTFNITEDVLVQGRYTLGLTKAFDTLDGRNGNNGNAQIAIGYRF